MLTAKHFILKKRKKTIASQHRHQYKQLIKETFTHQKIKYQNLKNNNNKNNVSECCV